MVKRDKHVTLDEEVVKQIEKIMEKHEGMTNFSQTLNYCARVGAREVRRIMGVGTWP